jgi:hypothetical protein
MRRGVQLRGLIELESKQCGTQHTGVNNSPIIVVYHCH